MGLLFVLAPTPATRIANVPLPGVLVELYGYAVLAMLWKVTKYRTVM